jgi:hypothetical protein
MPPTDIYAIFGTALEDAILSVRPIGDAERRAISLVVRRVGDMVAAHLEYYSDGSEPSRDGIGEKTLHSIVAGYGGSIQASADDGARQLDVVMPVAQ